jgi:radial spoke head protein 4A
MVDGEDEPEEGQPVSIIINPEFEGFPNDQLLNLSNWSHHAPYLLPQGRTIWENPQKPKNAEENEENEEEEQEDAVEPEVGPQILGQISADECNGNLRSANENTIMD